MDSTKFYKNNFLKNFNSDDDHYGDAKDVRQIDNDYKLHIYYTHKYYIYI